MARDTPLPSLSPLRRLGLASPASRLLGRRAAVALLVVVATVRGAFAEPAADSSAAPTASAPPAEAEARLLEAGFENVAAERLEGGLTVAYENRRHRHSVEALALATRAAGGPVTAIERRLNLRAAAIVPVGEGAERRYRVRFPSDPDFPPEPRGARWPTARSVDLVVGPLLAYELGRPFQPVQFQLQVEPRLRYNPWPGARATASVVVPVYNDFIASSIHPDVDQVRPGLLTLEQFAWIPRVALCSGTVGLFGDNRYGVSLGAARPLFDGQVLLDTQVDLTGFISFESGWTGFEYSVAENLSSFAGITWRLPILDVSLHARIARFLYGDEGEHVEFRRSMGDVDLTFFAFHSGQFDSKGVKFTFPVPPMTRATQRPVRIQPIERFPFGYRTETETVGLFLTGVASREDFLRQLSAPTLHLNEARYRRALGETPRAANSEPVDWVSFSGMTGFINTPWAGTIQDRTIELGASHVPKKWAYDGRGRFANEPWTLTIGVVPRAEIGLRFTRSPGNSGTVNIPGNRITTDTDHMASWRLTLLTARPGRPGLAIGVDDVEGTRRFHSSYLVAGLPFSILHVQNRLSLGYASRVFTAARHVLDGGFGAFEMSPWRVVAARIEYDTEKWNAGIGVALGYGLRLRVAALNMETVSVGAGWSHGL